MCFHDGQKRDGHTFIWCVATATQFVSATDGIDCSISFRPSHLENCVAIAIYLIVSLIFPLSYWRMLSTFCVVYSRWKLHSWRSRTTENVFYFATDGMCCYGNMSDHGCTYCCFCGAQWLFIHVTYIKCWKCQGFWLERRTIEKTKQKQKQNKTKNKNKRRRRRYSVRRNNLDLAVWIID